jgi:hypothetical protein
MTREESTKSADTVGCIDLLATAADARDNVVARFAVVRRERLATGLL